VLWIGADRGDCHAVVARTLGVKLRANRECRSPRCAQCRADAARAAQPKTSPPAATRSPRPTAPPASTSTPGPDQGTEPVASCVPNARPNAHAASGRAATRLPRKPKTIRTTQRAVVTPSARANSTPFYCDRFGFVLSKGMCNSPVDATRAREQYQKACDAITAPDARAWEP